MAASTGRARSKPLGLPPTMMVRVPFLAPRMPPVTGASSTSTPSSAALAAMRWMTRGELVLMSTIRPPRAAPASTPPSPNTTCSTSEGLGREVNTISEARATSWELLAPLAPNPTSSATGSGRIS